jgi:hypothetical protein
MRIFCKRAMATLAARQNQCLAAVAGNPAPIPVELAWNRNDARATDIRPPLKIKTAAVFTEHGLQERNPAAEIN